jgi:hypothetical protein
MEENIREKSLAFYERLDIIGYTWDRRPNHTLREYVQHGPGIQKREERDPLIVNTLILMLTVI